MKVRFESSFARDLRRIKTQRGKERVGEAIQAFEKAGSLAEIGGIRKLRGADDAFRLRMASTVWDFYSEEVW